MTTRCHISIRGAVQGVGFRPFIFRLATELSLTGWVINSAQGVFIEVEGVKETIDLLLLRIQQEKPSLSFIHSFEFTYLDPVGFEKFEIRHSDDSGTVSAFILPDIATCPDCVKDIFTPENRRYLYPFTNCTNCGPRFSIIEALPYDRHHTTMKIFDMCEECRFEYDNPLDRRFHAQPNACPKCGPVLELWDEHGKLTASHHEAVLQTVAMIRSGKTVAIKGLGGFHLVADARNDAAIIRLRNKKHREEKPFALMFPTLESVKACCTVSPFEERLLCSPESPIVLLRRNTHIAYPISHIADSVAPRNPYLGIMLPYTPLHHILMKELGFPIVATSGNISDEPICTDESEALKKLHGIADGYLVHNRPIKRHVDDSITRVMLGRELVLRRARGYAPLPIDIAVTPELPLLAVGAHLKNTVAIASSQNVFISQHIGDLETAESFDAFQHVVHDLQTLYKIEPKEIICDMHPQYLSTAFARQSAHRVIEVQHHYAHVASCMAENQLKGRALGVSWDGTGYGLDGSIWGGEFLLTGNTSFERVASFRQFMLPGGEKAIKEPRRTAFGVLFELYGEKMFEMDTLPVLQEFTAEELALIRTMLQKNLNSPRTSSAGRLFDAVGSLIQLRQKVNFEGQAAMELEFLTDGIHIDDVYPFGVAEGGGDSTIVIDWFPLVEALLHDASTGVEREITATKFHNTLTEIILTVAEQIGEFRVLLTGGCFQNVYLAERTVRRLEAEGFHPYWHQRVPPNDGGIALGQIYAAMRKNDTQVPQSQLFQEEILL